MKSTKGGAVRRDSTTKPHPMILRTKSLHRRNFSEKLNDEQDNNNDPNESSVKFQQSGEKNVGITAGIQFQANLLMKPIEMPNMQKTRSLMVPKFQNNKNSTHMKRSPSAKVRRRSSGVHFQIRDKPEIKLQQYSADLSITDSSNDVVDFESVQNEIGTGGAAKDNLFKEIAFSKQSLLTDVLGNIPEHTRSRLRRDLGMRSSSMIIELLGKNLQIEPEEMELSVVSDEDNDELKDSVILDNQHHLKPTTPMVVAFSEDGGGQNNYGHSAGPSPMLKPSRSTALLNPMNMTTVDQHGKNELNSQEEKTSRQAIETMKARLRKLNSQSSIDAETQKSKKRKSGVEKIAQTLQKPHIERSTKENDEINKYMTANIAFFQKYLKKKEGEKSKRNPLTLENKMKIYECLMFKVYGRHQVLCEFDTRGDRFYIILEGQIGVKVPQDQTITFSSTWEVFLFVLKDIENIRRCRDENSKICSMIIKLIGTQLVRKLEFSKAKQLVDFIKKLENDNSGSLYNEYPDLNQNKIRENQKALTSFRVTLINEIAKQKQGQKITPNTIKIQYMGHVNELSVGQTFGSDSLLDEKAKLRNATCYVMTKRAVTAVLTKQDYLKVLGEPGKLQLDQKINQILSFSMFQKIPKVRIKSFYQIFYDKKTQQAHKAYRNQYLYRQDDDVDGVYCILEGQVKRIKEFQSNIKNTKYAKITNSAKMLDLQHKTAQQTVLTLIQKGTSIGEDDVVLNKKKRSFSMQVVSEPFQYLYISAKDFQDKILTFNYEMKQYIYSSIQTHDDLIEDLELKRKNFQVKNHHAIALPPNKPEPEKKQTETKESFVVKTKNEEPASSGQQSKLDFAKKILERRKRPQVKSSMGQSVMKSSIESVVNIAINEQSKIIQMPLQTNLRLENQIDLELQKDVPNVEKLVRDMKSRRQQIAIDIKEKKQEQLIEDGQAVRDSQRHFDSSSKQGKIDEHDQIRRFKAVYLSMDHRLERKNEDKKLNIKSITGRLSKDATSFSSNWKSERLFQEKVNKILHSLSADKEIHRLLKQFDQYLPQFLEYLLEQDEEFIDKLRLPRFDGSMIYDYGIKKNKKEQSWQQQSTFQPKKTLLKKPSSSAENRLKIPSTRSCQNTSRRSKSERGGGDNDQETLKVEKVFFNWKEVVDKKHNSGNVTSAKVQHKSLGTHVLKHCNTEESFLIKSRDSNSKSSIGNIKAIGLQMLRSQSADKHFQLTKFGSNQRFESQRGKPSARLAKGYSLTNSMPLLGQSNQLYGNSHQNPQGSKSAVKIEPLFHADDDSHAKSQRIVSFKPPNTGGKHAAAPLSDYYQRNVIEETISEEQLIDSKFESESRVSANIQLRTVHSSRVQSPDNDDKFFIIDQNKGDPSCSLDNNNQVEQALDNQSQNGEFHRHRHSSFGFKGFPESDGAASLRILQDSAKFQSPATQTQSPTQEVNHSQENSQTQAASGAQKSPTENNNDHFKEMDSDTPKKIEYLLKVQKTTDSGLQKQKDSSLSAQNKNKPQVSVLDLVQEKSSEDRKPPTLKQLSTLQVASIPQVLLVDNKDFPADQQHGDFSSSSPEEYDSKIQLHKHQNQENHIILLLAKTTAQDVQGLSIDQAYASEIVSQQSKQSKEESFYRLGCAPLQQTTKNVGFQSHDTGRNSTSQASICIKMPNLAEHMDQNHKKTTPSSLQQPQSSKGRKPQIFISMAESKTNGFISDKVPKVFPSIMERQSVSHQRALLQLNVNNKQSQPQLLSKKNSWISPLEIRKQQNLAQVQVKQQKHKMISRINNASRSVEQFKEHQGPPADEQHHNYSSAIAQGQMPIGNSKLVHHGQHQDTLQMLRQHYQSVIDFTNPELISYNTSTASNRQSLMPIKNFQSSMVQSTQNTAQKQPSHQLNKLDSLRSSSQPQNDKLNIKGHLQKTKLNSARSLSKNQLRPVRSSQLQSSKFLSNVQEFQSQEQSQFARNMFNPMKIQQKTLKKNKKGSKLQLQQVEQNQHESKESNTKFTDRVVFQVVKTKTASTSALGQIMIGSQSQPSHLKEVKPAGMIPISNTLRQQQQIKKTSRIYAKQPMAIGPNHYLWEQWSKSQTTDKKQQVAPRVLSPTKQKMDVFVKPVIHHKKGQSSATENNSEDRTSSLPAHYQNN